MTKQEGLDASGFLLLGLGHLEKAGEMLPSSPSSLRGATVLGTLDVVIPAIRDALKLLKPEKEK